MLKKIHIEVVASIAFVLVGTLIVYNILSDIPGFWNAQNFWSVVMLTCWVVVAAGYWHQGSLLQKSKVRSNISPILPVAVFLVQCTLFVKGIYYDDTALVIGALLVNSAVVFYLYQLRGSKWL